MDRFVFTIALAILFGAWAITYIILLFVEKKRDRKYQQHLASRRYEKSLDKAEQQTSDQMKLEAAATESYLAKWN